ncbi:unnamed protein product [Effrenium voratum]|nr:unnamed protein product [Effrenium voratum]
MLWRMLAAALTDEDLDVEMLRSLGLPGRSWQKVLRRPPEAAEEASATLALLVAQLDPQSLPDLLRAFRAPSWPGLAAPWEPEAREQILERLPAVLPLRAATQRAVGELPPAYDELFPGRNEA